MTVIIHYSTKNWGRRHVHTACGRHFSKLPATARHTDDFDSVDCEKCLESDEYKANKMEDVLSVRQVNAPSPSDWGNPRPRGHNYIPTHQKRLR